MSVGILITATDTAGPAAKRVGAVLVPARLNRVIGRAATTSVQTHLYAYNRSHPNRLGGRRTNFYAGAGDGTNFKVVSDTSIVVSIPHVGIAQRYYGGTIRPKTAQYLTIPARTEAHGKRAREFPDLEVLRRAGSGEPFALARKVNGAAVARGGGEILFWLKKEITQRPDPSVLPSDDVLGAAVQKDVNSVVNRAIGGSAGGTAP